MEQLHNQSQVTIDDNVSARSIELKDLRNEVFARMRTLIEVRSHLSENLEHHDYLSEFDHDIQILLQPVPVNPISDQTKHLHYMIFASELIMHKAQFELRRLSGITPTIDEQYHQMQLLKIVTLARQALQSETTTQEACTQMLNADDKEASLPCLV